MRLSLFMFALVFVALSGGNSFAGPAQMVIVNSNGPGFGLNDPTPAAPVGGNTGTTLGEQRLIAFQYAANIWGARLDSNVPIRIEARFASFGAGILGSASTLQLFRDFPNEPLSDTWYHVALANKLAGFDLSPDRDDIRASFSTNINFYMGLDNNHGAQVDLVTVMLHEFAHALGFSQFAELPTGILLGGFPDVYHSKLLDTTLGLHWNQMTNAQRAASATRFGRVVWDGAFVSAGVANVLLFGSPDVKVTSPPAIAGSYQFGPAVFGPAIGNPNVSANVVAAEDAVEVGGTSTDGCSPFTNAAVVAGKIVLIERGLCLFAQKARNATEAGAVGVIIYNNAANANAAPPTMADDGINGQFVTIPTVSLRRADGLSIRAQLGGGVTASIEKDQTIRAGADAQGRARVYAPLPFVVGSSISHYDTVASRNLLMEPTINADLTHKVKAPDDLTFELLRDIGWTFPDADGDGFADDEDCNPNSDLRPTIVIGEIDTGVRNTLFNNGCSSADLIAQLAASARNHGEFVSAVANLTNQWVASGLITGQQKGAIESAAARFR